MTGLAASPSSNPDATALLAETARLGGYFAMAGQGTDRGAHLSALTVDPAAVAGFTDRTRSAIAASMGCDPHRIPIRLAASSFQLNVVSRVISPVLGAAVCGGRVPLFTPESVRWRDTGAHTPQLHTTEVECAPAPTSTAAAGLIAESLLSTIVGPLNDTLRSTMSLSSRVSWGNTISAANGAVTVLAMSRPDLEKLGRALVQALLGVGPLRGAGQFTGAGFVRRSCCLFYQAPGAGLCQDCVLTVSDGSLPTRAR
ncbi:(2Fe-2S)-binding protein [Mycolicibacterium sp. 050158]|uniref:(2Fe-2S)-binding protein n=1 Tax=Mycolicibacterium sp. 050158 TaxID=3090602 RepID=UPI00299DAC40|nr:(2Fe-2S)-binding protein [Mycolicibacterium sp. 050158]MDX1888077.1 (2Fe-2S)-binding protein [Mycolicibacterium sp. 050158]